MELNFKQSFALFNGIIDAVKDILELDEEPATELSSQLFSHLMDNDVVVIDTDAQLEEATKMLVGLVDLLN